MEVPYIHTIIACRIKLTLVEDCASRSFLLDSEPMALRTDFPALLDDVAFDRVLRVTVRF